MSFPQSSNLKCQNIKQTEKKSYKCDICDKSYTTRNSLKKHKLKYRTEKLEVSYEPITCTAPFTQSSRLTNPKNTHREKKGPYKCAICNKSFSEKGILTKHIRIHTGVKLYKCNICNVSFTESGNLRSHMRIHTGEKPNKCSTCKMSFAEYANLKNHIRTHTGEKPYKCTICNESFARRGNLKRHKLTHTGDKPYICKICKASFTRSGYLKKHMHIHPVK